MSEAANQVDNDAALLEEITERLKLAGIVLDKAALIEYFEAPDILAKAARGAVVPAGYKRCGRCEHVKKYHLFNKNSGAKTFCTGNCKECQRGTAKTSYGKTKQKRNYKKYYRENKEMKQSHARKYYAENKEEILKKQKQYHGSRKGKKVMRKAHEKRRRAMEQNRGIPYTRALVIERDSTFIGAAQPICYLCQQPIKSTDGKHLHIDHVVPIVMGGLDCFTNVASTHENCNLTREKDARELTTEQRDEIVARAEAFIDANPEKFEDGEE